MLFMSYQTITVTPSFHTHALRLTFVRGFAYRLFAKDFRFICQVLASNLPASFDVFSEVL
jgi:hypothetical protein